ncbi:DNA-directed DNA/RNA polymerase mu isoform X3 [Scyliorhinus canicula]|uniref:DNA-directed DNA/RNA polymerase mu isoform X3 n=1 Tax=Scyliorhinus canicula TaxID=7830 RepID=UPI0018F2B90C|nr:DNA-directed DNA/RNA polymerase mu isoform X3 [Scyliorhinus canicula]
MALVPRKKKRKDPALSLVGDSPVGAVKFGEAGIFLVERRMGSSRRSFLTELARKKGFRVEEQMSESVTHVVSENNSGDEVLELLEKQNGICRTEFKAALVDITWFTESMGAGKPLQLENRHRLQDALKILAENAELSENEGRYLAFTRASSVLKSLPYNVTKMDDLKGIPNLGDHSRKVIEEILEGGTCNEVQNLIQNERYQTLMKFTSIFGVGVKTADKWFREGLRTLNELRASKIKFTKQQEAGLLYYEDLILPVTKVEADLIQQIIEEAVHRFLPSAVITLTGGFRRGKEYGHDVDFLITHREEGREEGLISKVISWMTAQGIILYDDTMDNSYHKWKNKESEIFDRFAKCFSIFKLQKMVHNLEPSGTCSHGSLATNETRGIRLAGHAGSSQHLTASAAKDKDWKAVRVDLVVVPFGQYAYALLGWTGSRLFERDLRRYAKHFGHMMLNSHSLFDNKQNKFLLAATEEEIFAHLGLDYIPPQERNA